MDAYVRAVKALQPLAGFNDSFLPGGVEAARARIYRNQGIPVAPDHQQRLEEVAAELGLRPPWHTA
jgi:LDH2 family malate/lactate/ureidoglycolate dehydrogenase